MPNSELPRAEEPEPLSLFEEPPPKRKKRRQKLIIGKSNEINPAIDLMGSTDLNNSTANCIDVGEICVPSIREEDIISLRSLSSVIQRCKCPGGSKCFRKSHKTDPHQPCPSNVELTQTNRHTVCNSCRKKKTGKRYKAGCLVQEKPKVTEQTAQVTVGSHHSGDAEVSGEMAAVAVPFLTIPVPVPHPPPQMY
jgi:hypothetical protein